MGGRGSRLRRKLRRRATPMTIEKMRNIVFGLHERIRKAEAGIGGGATGNKAAKLQAWRQSLKTVERELARRSGS